MPRPLLAHARAILRAAIDAADPYDAVTTALRTHSIPAASRVHVLAIGKAAPRMANAARAALPHTASCLAIAPHDTPASGACEIARASHPVPDESSAHAGARVLELLGTCGAGDFILVLLSGGASSLCVSPLDGIPLAEYAATVRTLLQRGADIHALNTVRSHIDALKGGGMARLAAPARVLGLVVSDVPGDAIDVIASGPLSAPSSSVDVAIRIVRESGVHAPAIARALDNARHDTTSYDHVDMRIILDNSAACAGAAARARELGYRVISGDSLHGEARDAGAHFARTLQTLARDAREPTCVIAGGETTVTVRGNGRGGRNQELVLAAALRLERADMAIGSAGTDGIDGFSPAAGAVADTGVIADAAARGLDPHRALADNDSFTLLDALGATLVTGPTGTNVMDVAVGLVDPRASR